MPSFDHFQRELRAQFDRAEKRRAKNIVVNSGELHRAVGGYPGPNERLQTCCEVMKEEVRSGDVINGRSRQRPRSGLDYSLSAAARREICGRYRSTS